MNTAKLAKLLASLTEGKPVSVLAKKMGVNAQSLRGYIRDEGVIPGTDVMNQIADYMGIGLSELMEQVSDSPKNRAKEKVAAYRAFSADREIERLKTLPQTEKLRLAQMLISEAIVA